MDSLSGPELDERLRQFLSEDVGSRDVTTESLVDTLEAMRGVDLGVGAVMAFGMSEHQASHKVWGTVLDAGGNFQTIDMD